MIKRFDEDPTSYTRALQIWQILIAQATNRQTTTYGALARTMGYQTRGAQFLTNLLEPVMRYCQENVLPPLTIIVVNQQTGKPGVGLSSLVDLNADREKVFNYPWFTIYPPTLEEFEEAHRRNQG